MDVGVIGTGAMGRNHVRIYSEMREADSVYIYDADEKAARALAEKSDLNVCDSVQSLLNNVNAVSICAPTFCLTNGTTGREGLCATEI